MLLSFVMAAAVLASPASAVEDDGPPPDDGIANRYVVVLQEAPNVVEFGQDGLGTAAAENRANQLVASQQALANAVGVSQDSITVNYTTALNGFAAALTDRQVEVLKASGSVSMVLKDELRQPQTESSTGFIGVSGRGEAWSQGVTGEDVVIGVIDSGIWPEHPSLADDGSYSDLGIELDETFYPACDFGNTAHNANDVPFECNNKLIGARQVIPTYRALIGAEDFEFDSARDDNGHGTHTATTAGGNAGVPASVLGNDLGEVSGVAPRARIIAYKGLGTLGGFGSDLAAAIDQAVFDGVDVINYSIGGGASGSLGPDDIAFLFAADANVWVATSAGNSGPGEQTIGGPAHLPWLTTVGASTQERFLEGRVRYGGRTAIGASVTGETERLPIVDAEYAGGDLCVPGSLNPEIVEGKIVLCRRGAIARAAKSLAVYQAGGAGMVLYNNNDVDNLITDTHWVPSVHIDNTPGVGLKKWIANAANPTAKIAGTARATRWNNAPTMAIFSSRGQNPVSPDLIKPDVTAPGVQILAGNTPFPDSSVPGELFQAIQGTSMSSPHVAGHFALLRQVHPDWTAAMAKSAIMTTAHQDVKDNDRRSDADPFDMGAGHIDPGRPQVRGSSFQPGLVYNAGFFDYLGFLCDDYPAELSPTTCPFLEGIGFPTTAENLNLPSIGVAEVPGSITVQRTVTSVAPRAIRFNPIIKAPAGYKVEVSPRSMKLNPGESATYQLTITNVRAPLGEWRHGSITWKNGPYEARSPISVRGTDLQVPGAVEGSGVDGSGELPISFGYSGGYEAAGHGLVPATVINDTVNQDVEPDGSSPSFDPSDVDSGAAVKYDVTTSGDAGLLIELPPESVSDGNVIDLDVFVLDEDENLVASSTAGGTFESIVIPLPADGTYSVYVHGWATGGAPADYTLYIWTISATPGGNLSIDSQPADAVIGTTGEVAYSWSGAAAGEWHKGAISHSSDDGLLTLTLVDVDNRGIGG